MHVSSGPPPFQRFLDAHRGPVWRLLVATVGPDDAEDCFQETFMAALRAYPGLREDSNLRAWVLTIAHRKAMDVHRARARRPLPVADPEPAGAAGSPGRLATTRCGAPCARSPPASGLRSCCATSATFPIARSRRRSAARSPRPGARCTRPSSSCAWRCPREHPGRQPRRRRSSRRPCAAPAPARG